MLVRRCGRGAAARLRPATALVFAGTLISTKAQNDASAIPDLPGKPGLLEQVVADPDLDLDPLSPGAPFNAQLDTTYGTLDNFEFLTSDLTQFGPAGDQLVARFEQLVTALQAAHPGATFLVPPIVSTYLGFKNYELFGGPLSRTRP
jgi:hypothetical protein